jgi:predicted  nucleic acid-binding Zn-ribbon protein
LTSLNSTYANRIKKNESSVEDLNGKIKSLEQLIKDTEDSNELKKLETDKQLEN